MREIRTSGSEGGVGGDPPFLPLSIGGASLSEAGHPALRIGSGRGRDALTPMSRVTYHASRIAQKKGRPFLDGPFGKIVGVLI